MCHWPKCDLIIQLIFPSKAIFDNIIQFPMTKNYSKFIFSCISGLKFSKSLLLNPIWWLGPFNNTKNTPKFPYIFILDSN
jgi:hypothetical protein